MITNSGTVTTEYRQIIFTPDTGYHFASAPTANAGTITKIGNDYIISKIPDATPTADDNNDNHHDTTKTVRILLFSTPKLVQHMFQEKITTSEDEVENLISKGLLEKLL